MLLMNQAVGTNLRKFLNNLVIITHFAKSIIRQCFHKLYKNQFTEVVAIGPCGLDYHKDVSECDIQKEIFRRQIKLACDIQKPLLIHERSAQNDVMEILSRLV